MKRILLTSTALVAFAGAAAAEVTWNGDAEIGYNDKVENGFYWSVGAKITAEQELNNGVTVGFTLDVDIKPNTEVDAGPDNVYGTADDHTGVSTNGTFSNLDIKASDYVLYVKTDTAGLYFGDTDTATERLWAGTKNMQQDTFAEGGDADEEAQIRADVMYGSLDASISYHIFDSNGGTQKDDIVGMQLAAAYDAGQYNFGLAYQDGDNPNGEIFGLWAGATFGGADVKVAYAKNNDTDEDSLGLQIDMPVGPVNATVFYSAESATDDNYGVELAYENGPATVNVWYHGGNDEEIGLEGSYDVGNGVKLYAGFIQNDGDSDATEAYLAGTYDMGNDAELLVSYGDAGSTYAGDRDEIGDNFEVNEGTTVAVSFKF